MGDLLIRSCARVRLVFLGRVFSAELMSGGCAFRTGFGVRCSLCESTVRVCIVFRWYWFVSFVIVCGFVGMLIVV